MLKKLIVSIIITIISLAGSYLFLLGGFSIPAKISAFSEPTAFTIYRTEGIKNTGVRCSEGTPYGYGLPLPYIISTSNGDCSVSYWLFTLSLIINLIFWYLIAHLFIKKQPAI